MIKQTVRDDALLEAMAQDALRQCETWHRPCFIGFLDEREQCLVRNLMEKTGNENYMFWGGYAAAERVVFGAFPAYLVPEESCFPFSPVTVSFREIDGLCHRDFLGALMALGIERSTVGDILTEPGRCVLFLREEVLPYVLQQIRKIGAVGVTVTPGAEQPYPEGRRFRTISAVVSALRADCIAAACTGLSREKAKSQISAGLVSVNYAICLSPSQLLCQGDVLSIQGSGKFRLEETGRMTRKGRIAIQIKKYLS